MKPEKIEKIRFWMGSKLPRWMYKVAVAFRVSYKAIRMPEQKKSYGKLNPDKTFYVIRLFPPATGFLANYNYVLGYIKYALDKGWIPVVDMENYGTLYQEDEPVDGTRNVWEYFFEQPFDPVTQKRYTLKEVYQSKNVILGKADDQTMYDCSLDEVTLKWQHEISLLIPFKESMEKHVSKIMSHSLPNNKEIIGVPTRGSEQKKRVIGHPIAMNAEEILPILKQRSIEWGINNFFVKAEEMETVNYLEKNLQNVYYTNCERIDNYDVNKDVNASLAHKKSSKYESLRDYLVDIKILSMCTAIIGTPNNGIYTAIIWNGGKYSHREIIDNGVWK